MTQRCQEFRGVADQRRFVAFSAVRLGREVGCVGLDHEGTRRALASGIADLMCGLEGDDATEGNEPAQIEHALRVFPWTDEAMENGADRRMEIAIDGQRVFKRGGFGLIAGVDDDVEMSGGGEFEMLAQKSALAFAKRCFIPPFRRRMIIVQSRLADRANPRIAGEGGELIHRAVRRVMDVAWMDANAGVDDRILRECEIGMQIAKARRESDQTTDTGNARAFEKIGNFLRRETMGSEVTMGVGQHGR